VQLIPRNDRLPLHAGFLASLERVPENAALEVDGSTLTYRELGDRAKSIAATLAAHATGEGPPLTGVFAYRSATAFAGVLGTLLHGHGYVPLNRTFPSDRSRVMLQRAGCTAVIVDQASSEQLDQVLEGSEPLLIIAPDHDDVSELAARFPAHRVLGAGALEPPSAWEPVEVDPRAIAYLLFTSGSTGIPKGVMVCHENVAHFIDVMVERYGITDADRLSQTFDMTFDLSVFDMFVAWRRGACLCCVPERSLIKPGRFIQESRLTVWFSVPSTGIFMKRLGMLKPDRYPTLRWSLFCGEPLPVEVASAWAAAAPGSIVENLYGPTELTIACTLYRWDDERSPAESLHGLVPIGEPYPGMSVLVADGELREVAPGQDGELLLTGPQVTLGYWKDPEKTAAAFVVPPGRDGVHYRTGDLVRRPDGDGPLVYLGRIDNQIKINGHRVELGEVECVLREESGVDAAIALGWPRTEAGAAAISAFVSAEQIDAESVRERMARRLPGYMVPRAIHAMANLPLNANGKFDRKALMGMLEQGL
jgi:amino acid adenylation domain-containing protein